MSLAMMASKYTAGGGGARGDMRGFNFGPVAGTTTYGGAGSPWAPPGMAISRQAMGPGRQGDPGFFDFIGKAVRGVAGVVSKLGIPIISGAAGVVGGLLGGRGPGMPGPMQAPAGTRFGAGGGLRINPPMLGPIGAGVSFGEQQVGTGCGNGTRPNKSGYWLKSGQYVEPGSVCVRRRRMNPLNPRALSKAMRRIESAKRATAVLGRITIRKKC